MSKMWIGPEKLGPDVAATHIYEWCNKHLVPEGAKDLLVSIFLFAVERLVQIFCKENVCLLQHEIHLLI